MKIAKGAQPRSAVAVAETPEGLSAVLDPDCAAMIWLRQPLARFQNWIDGLGAEELPKARMTLRPRKVRRALFEICCLCGTPDCAERGMLIDDMAALSHIFADLMEAEYLLLRLDVVTTNACRALWADTATARLICTYRGAGTQYGVAPESGKLEQVSTVPTGAPILLRGGPWPERARSDLSYRAPPIEGTGEARLVLTLAPVTDPDVPRT